MHEFDSHIQETARERIRDLESHLDSDVILFDGPIYPSLEKRFRDFIEDLQEDEQSRDRIAIVLNTAGGSAETVEKLVDIVRYHYAVVNFIIPDEAMSAGTIFALSGDSIYMDYTSSLGPIDPQVHNGKEWVPALGYLDQLEKMLLKSKDGELTDAELLMVQNLDLAMLSRYEQAKNLTVTLLQDWLVKYKFKDWKTHASTGHEVTESAKRDRAKEIADMLSDNNVWHSHGRKIGVAVLRNVLKLKIEDYSKDGPLRTRVRRYSEFLFDYLRRHDLPYLLHSRRRFF